MTETSKTVDQALRLLREVGVENGTVADLTRRIGLSRTVTQRLLITLREHGFVTRRADGRFALGSAISALAARLSDSIRSAALPSMRDLAATLNETVVLTVRDGDEAVAAGQITAVDRVVRAEYPLGFRHPLSKGAPGRAILIASDAALVERLTAKDADPRSLRRMLAADLRRGYAVSNDELNEGAAGISAPVLDGSGFAVASIGIVTPAPRLPDPALASGHIIRAAAAVSRVLGD